jgi:hypothetical protein
MDIEMHTVMAASVPNMGTLDGETPSTKAARLPAPAVRARIRSDVAIMLRI